MGSKFNTHIHKIKIHPIVTDGFFCVSEIFYIDYKSTDWSRFADSLQAAAVRAK